LLVPALPRGPGENCRLTTRRPELAAVFPTFRGILLFAAAVGCHVKRRVPFNSSGEPIRYERLKESAFSETLINMIAASEVADDPEILDSTRVGERVRIFEEYATVVWNTSRAS
jgi:dnd system-associated protein 4